MAHTQRPASAGKDSGSTWRSTAWKLLLGVESLPAADYLNLIAKGHSVAHEKIRNDTFRTLTTDTGFQEKVKEDQLIRLLDAFVWSHSGAQHLTRNKLAIESQFLSRR